MKYIFIFLLAAFAFYEYIFYIPDYSDTTKSTISSYQDPETVLPKEKTIIEEPTQVSTRKKVKTIPFQGPPSMNRPNLNSKNTFKCDGRTHCSQMHSYEEAKYFLHHCPNTKMDGDHDGIPCERQFGRYD